jgi:WD40 repeat protein
MIDPQTLKKSKDFGTSGINFCMARREQTSELFVGNSDFKVYAVDAAADKPEFTPLADAGHDSYVTGAALANGTLITGGFDKQLIWWNSEDRSIVRKVTAHERWIRNLAASPDGSFVVSVADDMQAHVWSVADGQRIRTLDDHQPQTPHHYPSMLYAVAISPDGRFIATGDKIGHVAIWEAATGTKAGEVEAPVMYTWDPRQRRHSIGGIRSLAFGHDSKLLAVGGIGTIGNIDHLDGPHRIEVFDWQSGERKHEISNDKYKGLVEQLEFSRDGKWLFAAGGDHGGFVTFYDVDSGEEIRAEKAPMHVHEAEFSEDYSRLYTVGHGKIAVWEFEPLRPEPVPLKAPKPAVG